MIMFLFILSEFGDLHARYYVSVRVEYVVDYAKLQCGDERIRDHDDLRRIVLLGHGEERRKEETESR